MSVGTSIFLSAVLIAFVLLFNFTKDRWNWKKILLIWPLKTVLVIGVVGGLGYLIYDQHQNRLQIYEEYFGIKLNSSYDDVIFRRGTDNRYIRYDENKENVFISDTYIRDGVIERDGPRIRIKDNRVWRISCSSKCPTLSKVGIGTSLKEIEERFGEPDWVDINSDTNRWYIYKKYKTYIGIEKGKVVGLGIIEPDLGMLDEEINYPLQDMKYNRKDKPSILIKEIPYMTDDYRDLLEQYEGDKENEEFIKSPVYKKYKLVGRNLAEIRKVTDSSTRVVVYDEFVKKQEAKEKRTAEAAERKGKEETREKSKAEQAKRIAEEIRKEIEVEKIKNTKKENPISQIKPGMADWQVRKISGNPVKIEGKDYCSSYTKGVSIWYYSVKRKEGPYVTFACNNSLKTFEVTAIKTY